MHNNQKDQRGPWGRRLVPLGLALIPPACLILFVVRYAVDLPYSDEWALVSFIREAHQGTLSLRDLALAHNEHRMLFPRAILLALARLTDWNISYELAANIILASGAFALIAHQTVRTVSSLRAGNAMYLMPAISLTWFSLKQADNWLWGLQLSFWLTVLAVVAGIVALAMPVFRWWRFLASLALGVVASYSTAHGLLYWVAALPGVLTLPLKARRARIACRAMWVAVAVATIGSYLQGYHSPGLGSLTASFLRRPVDHIAYVLCYLGNPVGPNHILATCIAGFFGVLVLCAGGPLLLRSGHMTIPSLVPYYSLALYSLGSAVLTCTGRVHLGTLQAKVTRYVTMANPLWIAVFVLLYLLFMVSRLEGREQDARSRASRAWGRLVLALFLMTAVAVGRASIQAIPVFQDWHAKLAPARAELLSGVEPDLLKDPWAGVDLMTETAFLRDHRLAIFRDK